MMNRIDKKFRELRKLRAKAFIAYVTAGDPTLGMTERIVMALQKSGADIIELGIPFSDPIADGPTIQAASERALSKKLNLDMIFSMVKRLRLRTSIPLVFMTYYNPVLKYGLKHFFKKCMESEVDGVIVPDLPHEEAGELIGFGRLYGIRTVFLVAPTSSARRIKEIVAKSNGFIYYVSLTGVTGARKKLPAALFSKVRQVKLVTDKPVAVGFGVSDPAQAQDIAKFADGVIVGSAIVKIIGAKDNVISKVSRFAKRMANAIHNA